MLQQIMAACVLIVASSVASAQHHGRGMLENADANSDGMVARDEFLAARAEHFVTMDQNADGYLDDSDRRRPEREGRRGEMIRERLDANADGKISKDEFVNAGAPMFDRTDTDGNGALDAKEVEAVKDRIRQIRKHRPDQGTETEE
jgi:EF hand